VVALKNLIFMNIKTTAKIFALSALLLCLPAIALASIGVGVGTGKVNLDQPLKPGGIYDLPALPVLNTGDEPSDYKVTIEYHEGQETRSDMGLKPQAGWFDFTPETFRLEPGKVETVKITLTVPTKTTPGNYFAYLEAQPVVQKESGVASIGIAAASKLYFTVAPSNIFVGIYYRFISIYGRYHPWDTIILAVIAGGLLLFALSKKVKFQIVAKK
jgi:hypothetical protein